MKSSALAHRVAGAAAVGVGLALLMGGAQAQPALGKPEVVTVALDHARVMKLPENATTVIVGNPMIADVSVQKNGILVVTGKSFGTTNLIALDPGGVMLAESNISVRSATDTVMTVQRGMERESYSCTPKCLPSVQLGDATKFFTDNGGQITQRNALATSSK